MTEAGQEAEMPNPMELMKLFQNLQKTMADMQGKLGSIEATGTAGGDMVTVVINGRMEPVRVSISPDAIDPAEREMLEDLVRAALADAMTRVREQIRSEMAAGGLPISPDMLGL